jgi:hypothetical protein
VLTQPVRNKLMFVHHAIHNKLDLHAGAFASD